MTGVHDPGAVTTMPTETVAAVAGSTVARDTRARAEAEPTNQSTKNPGLVSQVHVQARCTSFEARYQYTTHNQHQIGRGLPCAVLRS